jgi:hypothetical protein
MPRSQPVAESARGTGDREHDRWSCHGKTSERCKRWASAPERERSDHSEQDEHRQQRAVSTCGAAERAESCVAWRSTARQLLSGLGCIALGEPQIGDQQRQSEQRDADDRHCGAERSTVPNPSSDDSLRGEEECAERVHGKGEQSCSGCSKGCTACWLLERTHEQVGRERTREREQRVHPAERPVDHEQLRGRGERGGGHPGERTGESTRKVVAERHGRERKEDRKPSQRVR